MKHQIILSAVSVLFFAPMAFAGDECSCPSKKSEATLTSAAAGKKKLSAYTKQIAEWAENGCEVSEKTLAKLSKACGCEEGALVKTIASLETHAASGCASSDQKLTKLAKMTKKAMKPEPKPSEQVGTIVWWSDVGCHAAKNALNSLEESIGARDTETLQAELSELETACAEGCPESKEVLASIKATISTYHMKLEKAKTSTHVARLSQGAEHGCQECKIRLDYMHKECDTKSPKALLAVVKDLEKHADAGCLINQTKLDRVSYLIWAEEEPSAKPAKLSKQVSQLTKWAADGCHESVQVLASLKGACGTKCEQELATKIATLEKHAKNGCQQSEAKLAKLAKLASANKGS